MSEKINRDAIDNALMAVAASIEPELVEKIEVLERENSEMRTRIDKLVEIDRERGVELTRYKALTNKPLRDAWLGEALEDLTEKLVVYIPQYVEFGFPEKCPKCDEDRKIKFMSPQNFEYSETCVECGFQKVEYAPVEFRICCIKKHVESSDGSKEAIFLFDSDKGRYQKSVYSRKEVVSSIPEDVSTLFACFDSYGEEFSVGYSDVIFETKELCQKACDWINEKEGGNSWRNSWKA